jgi:DNA-binding IclR family transcriptional regulator
MDIKAGDTTLLLHSAPGKALLSTMGPEFLRKLVHRLNAEAPEELWVRHDELMAELAAVRANGYAEACVDETRAMISVLLPQSGHEEQLALALCASPQTIAAEKERYVRLLRAAVSRHLGLVGVEPRPNTGALRHAS